MKNILLSAVALLLPIANAANAPDMKEGLWSIRIQTIDNPGNKKDDTTSTLCRNHAYDKSVEGLASGVKKNCTKNNESFQVGKYSIDSQCTVAGTVIATKGTVTYVGDTSAHAENHTTYSPAFYGVSESTIIMDQKYIGSCPAGAQPGDRTTADGRVTHLGRH